MTEEKEITIAPAKHKIGFGANISLTFMVPLLIVAITGTLLYTLDFVPAINSTSDASSRQKPVALGHDYYVIPALVEVAEIDSNGSAWDPYNSTGPDLYVEIFWKGLRVYQSATKEDSLVAKWSNAEVDLLDLALKGGNASVDAAIRAARINIAANENIIIRVHDSDLLGASELVAEVEISTTSLQRGETTYNYKNGSLRRLVLRVLDMNHPPDLLK